MAAVDLTAGAVPLAARRFHILALSGGGFRGLFTAGILAKLEHHAGARCLEMFDLIAGTSIGGIIALGLTCGVSAAEIRDAIATRGPGIFDARLSVFGRRLPFTSPFRPYLKTKFASRGLGEAIADIVGHGKIEIALEKLAGRVVVVSVNHSRGRAAILRSYPGLRRQPSGVTVMEAALATSAAPGYFPPQANQQGMLIDGGVIANAPDLVALTDAMSDFQMPLDAIRMLSIGTASSPEVNESSMQGHGQIGWIARRRLFQSTMAAQEDLAVLQAGVLLHDSHLRIDSAPAPEDASALGLDRADERASGILNELVEQAWRQAMARHALLLGHFARHRRAANRPA